MLVRTCTNTFYNIVIEAMSFHKYSYTLKVMKLNQNPKVIRKL